MIDIEQLRSAAQLASELEALGRKDLGQQTIITIMIEPTGIDVRGSVRSSREAGNDYFGSMLVTWEQIDQSGMVLERAVRTIGETIGIH